MSATATPAFNSSAPTDVESNRHPIRQPVTRKTARDMRGLPFKDQFLMGALLILNPANGPGNRSMRKKNNGVPPSWEARRAGLAWTPQSPSLFLWRRALLYLFLLNVTQAEPN